MLTFSVLSVSAKYKIVVVLFKMCKWKTSLHDLEQFKSTITS